MKIAVVGAGVAGISAAFNLQKHHEVTIFESETDIGGHANTVPVEDSRNRIWNVDTGFIVFNEYLNFYAVIGALFIILSGLFSIPAQYKQINE